MDFIIRKAERQDIEELIGFQQKLAHETEGITLDATILRKGLNALFDDTSKGFYNVAVLENEVIGCHMITYEWSDWRNGWVYWIQSVYIKERYRKHGVFKKMYESLKLQILKTPEIIGLRLYVDKTNLRAQAVYKAMGMNGEHYTVFEWMK